MKKIFLALVAIIPLWTANAQQTLRYAQPHKQLEDATERYDERAFGVAQQVATLYLERTPLTNLPAANGLTDVAELLKAKSAVRLNMRESEKLISNYIRWHNAEPACASAGMEMANYYYEKGDYDKALHFFESRADASGLSNDELSELKFKTGYAYFARKKYASAKSYFKEVRNVEASPYYGQANYYFGLVSFFERNYKDALSAFKIAEKTPLYSKVIPYNICQILFAEKKYDDLIAYAAPTANDTRLKDLNGIVQLIGQAYFEKGDYKTALPYLEKYVSTTNKVTEKDFYQVGYTQYKTGAYAQATQNFEQLRNQKNELGQNALYHLADCYLKTGNSKSARSAYKEASTMNNNPTIQQTSQFNYAKLTYQQGNDQEALNSLKNVPENSPYHADAQDLMADVLDKMSDYQSAIDFIDKLGKPTAKQRAALQRAHYNRGLQLLNQNQLDASAGQFSSAEKDGINLRTKALARYWLGEIGMRNKRYETALYDFNNFATIAKTLDNLPEESSLPTAYYNMGYVYFNNKKYGDAVKFFGRAIEGIDKDKSFYQNPKITQGMYPEAVLMSGDAHFKLKEYGKANSFYSRVINGNYKQADYAMLQQSKIASTKEDFVSEIGLLDNAIDRYPNTEYGDVMLFRKGEALVLKGAGQSEIVNNYSKLLTKYPKSSLYNVTLLKLGNFYTNLDQKDKALEYYKRVLQSRPTQREALDARNAIEGVYLSNGDETGYISYLNTLPEGGGRNIKEDTLTYQAAYSLYNKGDYNAAAVKATNYMTKFPKGFNFWDALTIRADAFYNINKYSEAASDYDKLISHGNDRNYIRNLDRAATIYYEKEKNYGKAYTAYSKLADATTDEDQRTSAKLGQLRSAYQNKQYDDVIPQAQAALQSKTLEKLPAAEFNYYLAKAAGAKKDKATAKTAWINVIANADDERGAEARYEITKMLYEDRKLAAAEDNALNYAGDISAENQDWAVRILLILSDIYTEKNEGLNAKVTLGSILENYPNADKALIADTKQKLARLDKNDQDNSRIITPTDAPATEGTTEPIPDAPSIEPDPTPVPPKTTTPKTTPKATTPKAPVKVAPKKGKKK